MKTYIPLICMTFMLSNAHTAFSQQFDKIYFNNEAFKADMYGPVKSQRLIVNNKEGLPQLRDVGQETYILEEKYNNKQIRTTEQLFNTEGLEIGKSEILHDKNGFATEILYTDLFDNLINRVTYEYDADGNWKRVTKYDVYYNPMEIIYYDYTPDKQISEIKKTNEAGIVLERQIFLYDSIGNNIELIDYGKEGKQLSHTEYLYNPKGKVVSYRTLEGSSDNMVLYYEANFQNDTLLLNTVVEKFLGEMQISREEFIFDPLGNILKSTNTDLNTSPAPSTTEYLYEWDLWGNWTKQVIKKDGVEKIAAERTIEYYQ